LVKIWIDILTPKQALMFGTMAKKLMKMGYDVYVTTRRYDYTLGILDNLGIRYEVVGGYGGATLYGKLKADIRRMNILADLVNSYLPDLLLAYPNPSASRVAYGLGVKYIAFTDSPHSIHASRLSLPLATIVIFPKAIPLDDIKAYVHPTTRLMPYNGVDEVLWIKEFKPNPRELDELGLSPFNYVVVRPAEVHAAYYRFSINFSSLIKRLSSEVKVLLLPRYREDYVKFKGMKNVIIPSRAVYGPNISYYSIMVISGGGTMTREAALLGVPAINLYPEELYVDRYVMERGFPLFKAKDVNEALELVFKVLDNPRKYRVNTLNMVMDMEDPLTKLLEVLGSYEEGIDNNG